MISLESSAAAAGAITAATDPAFAQFRDQTRFWIQRVAVPLLMVIGVFGNLITIIIMTRRRMRSTTNMYLAALALVDMFYLVLTFLLGLSHYPNMAMARYRLYWHLRPFLMMLTDACSNTSVWLTVTFTIERYIAVRYPMKGKVWCTEARARMLISCVFVFGIVFAAPVPFEWKVIEKRLAAPLTGDTQDSNIIIINNSTNHNNELSSGGGGGGGGDKNDTYASYALALDYSDFGRNDTYKTIYYWSTAVIFYFIPLFSLSLFNGYLIKSVHQSLRERNQMTVGQQTTSAVATSASSVRQKQSCAGKPIPAPKDQPQGEGPPPNTSSVFPSITMDAGRSAGAKVTTRVERTRLGSFELQSNSTEEAAESLPGRQVASETHHRGDATTNHTNKCSPIRNGEPITEVANNGLENVWRPNGEAALILTKSVDCPQLAHEQGKAKPERSSIRFTFAKRDNHHQQQQHPTAGGTQQLNTGLSVAPVSSPASSQERRITIMLIAVVILFLFCQIPSALMLLYTSFRELEPNTNEHAIVLALGNLFNFLMAVNAAGNFILYSFLSKKYRKTFVILFCYCLKPVVSSVVSERNSRCSSMRSTTTTSSMFRRQPTDKL